MKRANFLKGWNAKQGPKRPVELQEFKFQNYPNLL